MTLHVEFFAGWLVGVLTCFVVVGLVTLGQVVERRRVVESWRRSIAESPGEAPPLAGVDPLASPPIPPADGKVPIFRRDDTPTEQFPVPAQPDPKPGKVRRPRG